MEFKGKTMTDDGKSRPDFLMLALLFKVFSTENTIRGDTFYLGIIILYNILVSVFSINSNLYLYLLLVSKGRRL